MKRIGILLLALIMLLQATPILGSAEESTLVFNDPVVEERVKELKNLGVFDLWTIDNVFFTETETVKRHEAAAAIVKLLGYEDLAGGNNGLFIDVADYYEHAGVISLVSNMGIMTGVGDGLFDPEGEISKTDFAKCLVYALGYGWKANLEGGYPTGYTLLASRLGLLDGTEGEGSMPLTRSDLVKIVYNTLEVPIYETVSVTGDMVQLSLENNHTLLSYFHDLYTDKGVVNSNATISLITGFDAKEDKILIDNDEVNVNGVESIFDYVGYSVEYNYKYDEASKERNLISFTISDKSVVLEASWRDVISANTGSVVVENENGKRKSYTISNNAKFIYNGEVIKTGINPYLSTFSNNLKLVDADENGAFDVVYINNYTYDKVVSNSITAKNMLYAENSNYDLTAVKDLKVYDSFGTPCTVDDIIVGDIIEIAQSASGKTVRINILKNVLTISGFAFGEDFVRFEGAEYYFSKNLSLIDKNNITTSPSVSIIFNSDGEIVWTSVLDNSSSFAYILKGSNYSVGFDNILRLKVVNQNGAIAELDCAEKVSINGIRYNKDVVINKLRETKTLLGSVAQGDISQIIKYELNSNGEIKSIETASDDTINSSAPPEGMVLSYKYEKGSGNQAVYRSFLKLRGGVLNRRYPISTNAVIFTVPIDPSIATEKEVGATTLAVNNAAFTNNIPTMEYYRAEASDIAPCAIVKYVAASGGDGAAMYDNRLFLVNDIYEEIGDGEIVKALSAYYRNSLQSFPIDSATVVDSRLSKGDIAICGLDGLGTTITDIVLLYDFETDTFNTNIYQSADDGGLLNSTPHDYRYVYDYNNLESERYYTERITETSSPAQIENTIDGFKKPDQLFDLHIYDAPEGPNSLYMKAYLRPFKNALGEDIGPAPEIYSQILTLEDNILYDQPLYHVDRETGEIGIGRPPVLVDYKKDKNNYSRVLVYTEDNYMWDMVVYY